MKHLRYALMAVVALAAVVFAIANRATATVDLWPLPLVVDLPVYLLGLGGMAIGFLVGVFLTGVRAWSWRIKAADRLRRAERAEARVQSQDSRITSLDAKNQDLESKLGQGPAAPVKVLTAPDSSSPSGPA